MRLLRGVLRWQAVLWAISGFVLLLAPGWLVEGLLDQPRLDQAAWLRVAGATAIALAAQMVLVDHRVEELWWWSWTFVLLEVATAAVFLLTAIRGVPDGAPAWPWWTLGVVNAAFAALEVIAIAKVGTERSPV